MWWQNPQFGTSSSDETGQNGYFWKRLLYPSNPSLRLNSPSSAEVHCLPLASDREMKGMWSHHSAHSHQVVRPWDGFRKFASFPFKKSGFPGSERQKVTRLVQSSSTSRTEVTTASSSAWRGLMLTGCPSFQRLAWIFMDILHSAQNY